jgi:hypothetical protein
MAHPPSATFTISTIDSGSLSIDAAVPSILMNGRRRIK